MITLNGKQIKGLLYFACPDEGDPDQLGSEITIDYFPGGENDPETGEPIPSGYYAWFSEYPEEGSIYLEP